MAEGAAGATTLHAGDAEARVDPEDGCRLTSLRVGGHELLVTEGRRPWWYGAFVMAPWAGRLRSGLARWRDMSRAHPTQEDGHASHGLVHSASWAPDGAGTWTIDLAEGAWFGPLRLRQAFELRPDGLTLQLVATALEQSTPVTLGWHPWFRRTVGGANAQLILPQANLLVRGTDGLPDGRTAPVGEGPFNDALVDHGGTIAVAWPGVLALEVTTDGPVFVVYDEDAAGVCIEPQTGPPDEVNGPRPRLSSPGSPVAMSVELAWSLP